MTKVLLLLLLVTKTGGERDDSGGRGNDKAVATMNPLSGRVNGVFAGGTAADTHSLVVVVVVVVGRRRVAFHRVGTAFDHYTSLIQW